MTNRNAYAPQTGSMMVGGGESSFVSAEMLKQVDVPVETLLGTVNGALSGAVLSSVVSAAVTLGQQEARGGFLKEAAKNLTGKHLIGVLAGTTALGALGGIVRYSRAVKHNEWSVGHYAHLARAEGQQPANFADHVKESRDTDEQGQAR